MRSMLCSEETTDSVSEVCGASTPVPGGVGPMTIACLLKSTLEAALQQAQNTVILLFTKSV